ncbi:hypothetical protein CHS0354_010611 [Potamilus streckersoni]|uniref:Uncharacterized protein n=1 Tax=Potamilus streckersoni TaxID=2493646 RepID=A0AAE0SFT7_9BIVA|nr:hypothetical protein CHS0354_010611 [Potamilus streckersoni]
MASRSFVSKSAPKFRIHGQGYQKASEGDNLGASSNADETKSFADSVETDVEKHDNLKDKTTLVEQLLGINQTLEKQIDTIRLRLDFDTRHHEVQKQAIVVQAKSQMHEKDNEIENLKQKLQTKDSLLADLERDNEVKAEAIQDLRRQLEALENDVENAKGYADDIQDEISLLAEEKTRLEDGTAYGDKDDEIAALKKEADNLRLNLQILEKELSKAKEAVTAQNSKIRSLENDKNNIQLKFKEELAKMSQSMKVEVQKMRDVMKNQWDEMRSLREQNKSMSQDIKEIKNMLLNGCLEDNRKETIQPSRTSVISIFNVSPLKPTPLALNKDSMKMVQMKRKL